MPMPELTARQLATILFCVLSLQLIYLYHEPIAEALGNPSPPLQQDNNLHTSSSVRKGHPNVPLTLEDLDLLDQLTETILAAEAHRVFAASGPGVIYGTRFRSNPIEVKKIRDQIHCWTKNGSWVRETEGIANNNENNTNEWSSRKHLGNHLFNQCDSRFAQGLEKMAAAGEGDFHMGEYDKKDNRWIVREAVKYRWVPDETICGPKPPGTENLMGLGDERSKYQRFNAQNFCTYLANRSLLLAGDVTQYQLHDSILSAVGIPYTCTSELDCVASKPHPLCPKRPSFLKYVRNDDISIPWAANPKGKDYSSGSVIEQAWATDEMLHQYKIVFLNKGLVWKPDMEFLTELVFTIKKLWISHPGNLFIYRATHPISNCMALKEQHEDEVIATPDGSASIVPGTTIQRPLLKAPERTSEPTDPQRIFRPTLADIQRQNKIAKTIVEAGGGIYLDTEEMFALRPDGRMGDGDCSRFCAPGPIDVYADLIYNTLRILAK
ncbi:hypothetical protein BGZ46_010088 [Entomortierella lignicola]|nr:hypothetical protein BGZ46_010088 [Entomortierella lignicola]